MGSVRATRQTVLPLWAEHLGQSPSSTSVVFGIAGPVDTLTFYPSGQIMDRAGRLWIAVPSMLVLGPAQAALPLMHGLAALTVVGMLMGFGNGIGSGILIRLGADVAPPKTRSQFLGVCGCGGFRLRRRSPGGVGRRLARQPGARHLADGRRGHRRGGRAAAMGAPLLQFATTGTRNRAPWSCDVGPPATARSPGSPHPTWAKDGGRPRETPGPGT